MVERSYLLKYQGVDVSRDLDGRIGRAIERAGLANRINLLKTTHVDPEVRREYKLLMDEALRVTVRIMRKRVRTNRYGVLVKLIGEEKYVSRARKLLTEEVEKLELI